MFFRNARWLADRFGYFLVTFPAQVSPPSLSQIARRLKSLYDNEEGHSSFSGIPGAPDTFVCLGAGGPPGRRGPRARAPQPCRVAANSRTARQRRPGGNLHLGG